MKIHMYLSSEDLHIDEENWKQSRGVVYYKFEKSPVWIRVKSAISAVLAMNIADPNNPKNKLATGLSYVDQEFVSDYNSKEYSECPFRLKLFIPEGSDAPTNFKLECVDEKISEEQVDSILGIAYGYKNKKRSLAAWYRYEEHKFNKKLSEMVSDINLVEPEITKIPATLFSKFIAK
jgi:hypothetical protein